MNPKEIISALGLSPHSKEGGFFKEAYRSAETLDCSDLPGLYSGLRNMTTAIYYLLTHDTFSAFHRLKSDEIFHFYRGDPIEMFQIFPNGEMKTIVIGNDILQGQQPQVLVPKGTWQGSHIITGGAYALLGCTVSPGFDFDDYEHGVREQLLNDFPQHSEVIMRLTRS